MRKFLLLSAIFITLSATLLIKQTINTNDKSVVANAEAISSTASATIKEPVVVPVVVPAALIETTITVKPGDTLITIAEANQTTTQRLYDANTVIIDPSLIDVGQIIHIPNADEVIPTRVMPVSAPKPIAITTPQQVSSAPAVADGSVWDQLARCESGGNWSINTGNGYFGGLQFSLSTWRAVGGHGLPSDNSREEQIARAEILLARSGWGQWPACTAKLGLR